MLISIQGRRLDAATILRTVPRLLWTKRFSHGQGVGFVGDVDMQRQQYSNISLVTWRSKPDLETFKAEFFRALGHPIRIRILELLGGRERSVQELQMALQLSQPLVSQQLAVLRVRNIVTGRRLGTTVRYALRDPLTANLLQTARVMFDNHLVATPVTLRQLRQAIEA